MLLARLPAGDVLGRSLDVKSGPIMWRRWPVPSFPTSIFSGSIVIDNRAFHDHRNWVHAPGFWLIAGGVISALAAWKFPTFKTPVLAFLAAILVHLCLDSLGGGIMWLWPFSDRFFSFDKVPATRSHWILSSIVHWTFWAEVLIVATAATLWWRRQQRIT